MPAATAATAVQQLAVPGYASCIVSRIGWIPAKRTAKS